MIDYSRKQIIIASTAAVATIALAIGVYFSVRSNSEEAKADKMRHEDLKHRSHVNNKWRDLKVKVEADSNLKKTEIVKMAKDLHGELAEYITKATFHSETRRDQLYKHNADKLAEMI